MLGCGLFGCGGMRQDDVLYTMLPMYHISANGLCSGAAMIRGRYCLTD